MFVLCSNDPKGPRVLLLASPVVTSLLSPAGISSGRSGGSTPASNGPAWMGPSGWCW